MYQQLIGEGSFCGHYIIVKLMTMKMITVTMMGVGGNDIGKDANSELSRHIVMGTTLVSSV